MEFEIDLGSGVCVQMLLQVTNAVMQWSTPSRLSPGNLQANFLHAKSGARWMSIAAAWYVACMCSECPALNVKGSKLFAAWHYEHVGSWEVVLQVYLKPCILDAL